MRLILALVGLVLTLSTAHAAPLGAGQARTALDLSRYGPDTIIVSTPERLLFYKAPSGSTIAYRIAVGSDGMSWHGTATVRRIAQWPDWIPPKEMLARKPQLPRRIAGGWGNPLGAYALYLFEGPRDTLYRIHGTNDSSSIGRAVTSGCIRLLNEDVTQLAHMVRVGTKVVVLQ